MSCRKLLRFDRIAATKRAGYTLFAVGVVPRGYAAGGPAMDSRVKPSHLSPEAVDGHLLDLVTMLWNMARALKIPQKVVDGARAAIEQIVSEESVASVISNLRQDVSKARLKAGDSPATEARRPLGVSNAMHVGREKMVGGGRLVHG